MNDFDNKHDGVSLNSTLNDTSEPASIYLAEYNLTLKSIRYSSMSEDAQSAILNVTREYPFKYATIMFGYIMPFVLILTIITNTLVVMVLAQKHMRTPTNIVLLTMAIVDMMTLLFPSPWYFYIYTLGYHDRLIYPPICCYFHHIMTDVVPVFFHTSSIWLALLLAGQRYIYVCHPTLASTWCTVPRVKRAIIVILVIAFLHQLTRFFDNTIVPIYLETDFGYQLACKAELANWVQSIDVAFYYTTYFTFRILFVFVIPCVALITLNCLLFGALRRAEDKRTELLRTKFKTMGGSDCGPASMAKQSSYILKIDRRTEPESASCLLSLARRPSSSSTAKPERRLTKSNKKKKFPIGPFKLRHILKHSHERDKHSSSLDNVDTNNSSKKIHRTTGDIRSDYLFCDEPSQTISGRTSVGMNDSNDRNGANRRQITGGTLSQDSNDYCSIGQLQIKECCPVDGHLKRQTNLRAKQFEFGLKQTSFEEGEEEGQSTKEDDSACLECATCKRNAELTCQGCSAISNEGATCEGQIANGHHLHQAVSQCSSLIGGATNTTTNEDVSSCVVTQNASSSLFVAHDGTMDGIEASSMKGEEVDIEQENLSIENNDSRLKDNEQEDLNQSNHVKRGMSIKLAKSGSMDSRLTCGCFPNVKRQSAFHSFRHTSSKSLGKTKRNCRECYFSEKYGNSIRKISSKQLRRKGSNCLQSSSSDPSLDCKEETSNNENNNDKITGSTIDNNSITHDSAHKKLPTSHSDYGNEICDFNKRSNDDTLVSVGNAAVTTTTTTTTTTLYSTNANSIGSLLQVQQNQAANPPINRQAAAQSSGASPQARVKSPSFASSIGVGGGRGSRTTSVGYMNIPPTLSNNLATASASLRTMDSNRTTLMLIVVVTVFLLVEVPVALVTILVTLNVFAGVEIAFNYIKLFTNFFIMISYSINFTIYCSMSKKFRETFRDLFLCGKRDKRKRLIYQQQQQLHSQYNQQHFNHSNNPENQVMTLNATNVNNNQITLESQNEFTTAISGLSHNAGLLRYCPYRRANSQQQECEL